MSEFNLIDQPWIPVHDTASGGHGTVSLADAFTRAHQVHLAEAGQEREVLLRLLLAVFDAAAGPETPEEWGQVWRAPTLPAEPVAAYWRRWHHKFNLFDPVHPIFQCGHLQEYHRDTNVLHPAYLGGAAGQWFNRISTDPVPPARAVVQLLVLIGYDVGSIKRGVPDGRTYGAWIGRVGDGTPTHLRGRTLKDELLLNLPPQPRVTDASGQLVDTPAWERDCPDPQPGRMRAVTGRRDYLTWPARLMRLKPDDDGNVIAVAWHDGDRPTLTGPDIDPVKTWRPHAKKPGEWLPWSPPSAPWLHAWRPVASLLHPYSTPHCPAVSHTLDRISEGHINPDYRLSIAQSHAIYNTHGSVLQGVPQVLSPAGTARMWGDRDVRTRMAVAGLFADQIAIAMRVGIRQYAPHALHLVNNLSMDPSPSQWNAFVEQLRTADTDDDRVRATDEWRGYVRDEAHGLVNRVPGTTGRRNSVAGQLHALVDRGANFTPDSLPGQAPYKTSTSFAAFGETKTLPQWADDSRCRVNLHALRTRVLRRGWPVADALATPPANEHEHPPPRAEPKPAAPKPAAKKAATKTNDADAPVRVQKRRGAPARVFDAFGEAKTLAEWSDDPRCQVSLNTLRQRLGLEWSIEEAITTKPSRGNRTRRPRTNSINDTETGNDD